MPLKQNNCSTTGFITRSNTLSAAAISCVNWSPRCATAPRTGTASAAADAGWRQDVLVSPQCSATLAHRWQVELRIHPDAGHDLPLDDPAWVIQQTLT
jgi:hypothetical protein